MGAPQRLVRRRRLDGRAHARRGSARVRAQFAYYEPLHHAVRGGHAEIVRLLLARAADPNAEGWGGEFGEETPVSKARDRERDDLLALLLAESVIPIVPASPEPDGPPPGREREWEFMLACHRGDRSVVERMLEADQSLATGGLYDAVHQAHADLVQLLFDAGANANAHMVPACWYTPLMHSIRYPTPRFEIAELLLEHGVHVDSTNGLGMTALHIAVRAGRTHAVDWLLGRGAAIDRVEPECCSTPLGWAARWGRREVARLLLDRGASPHLPEEHLWAQPRRWAEKKDRPEILRLLS